MSKNNEVPACIAGMPIRFSWAYARVLQLRRSPYRWDSGVTRYATTVQFRSAAGKRFQWTFCDVTLDFVAGQQVALQWAESQDGRHDLVGACNLDTRMMYALTSNIRKFWDRTLLREPGVMDFLGMLSGTCLVLGAIFYWLPPVMQHWDWLLRLVGADGVQLLPISLLLASSTVTACTWWTRCRQEHQVAMAPCRDMEKAVFIIGQALLDNDPRQAPRPIATSALRAQLPQAA